MMIAAVAAAAALAAAGAAVAMAGRRRWGYRGVAVAVAVCVHAAVLLSAVVYLSVVPSAGPGASSSSSSSLQETEVMKLTAKMEQIIENQEKYGKSDGMMCALASFLSKNPRIIKEMTYRITNPDGTEKAELAVTMKDDVKVQSPRTNDILEETPKRSEDVVAAPPQDETTMKRPQDEETTRAAHLQPLTKFLIPDDHVFVVDCAGDGDELTIHIKPRSDADADADAGDHLPPPPIACGGAGKPSLFDGGWYRALFWSLPSPSSDHQGAMVVPVPWASPGISDEEINATLKTTAAASSVRLSPDTVMLYWPAGEGNTAEVLVASMDYVGYVDVAGKPECRRAVSPLAQHAVLSTTPASFDTDDDGCVPRELGDDPQLMKRMHTSSS